MRRAPFFKCASVRKFTPSFPESCALLRVGPLEYRGRACPRGNCASKFWPVAAVCVWPLSAFDRESGGPVLRSLRSFCVMRMARPHIRCELLQSRNKESVQMLSHSIDNGGRAVISKISGDGFDSVSQSVESRLRRPPHHHLSLSLMSEKRS